MAEYNFPKNRQSFWHKTAKVPKFESLNKNEDVDIAIIGGGIAGVLMAYEAALTDNTVALYEARELICGTTGFTTSKLSAQHNLIYDELIERHGEIKAHQYYNFNMGGIHRILEIAEYHQIECGLRKKDAYVYTQDQDNLPLFEKEAEAYKKLSINGELVKKLNIDLPIEAAVVMHNQYEFQPVQFLSGVIEVLEGLDVKIYENTIVTDIKDGDTVKLTTDKDYEVNCKKAVCASHYPVHDPDKYYAKNMKPEMSFATSYKLKEAFNGDMYISYDQPRKTFRGMSVDGDEYILVGGESHTPGDGTSDKDRYDNIVDFAQENFDVFNVYAYWSSHDHMTKDRMPFVGKSDNETKNIYVMTGFSKWGLANAAKAAVIIKDMIESIENPYQDLLNPTRDIPDVDTFESEDDQVDEKPSIQKESIESLASREATIIERDGEKVGVYKDENGQLHYLDVTCTHLGCDLGWNDGDKSWDCACHGSRFSAKGEVIAGPANKPLKIAKHD